MGIQFLRLGHADPIPLSLHLFARPTQASDSVETLQEFRLICSADRGVEYMCQIDVPARGEHT